VTEAIERISREFPKGSHIGVTLPFWLRNAKAFIDAYLATVPVSMRSENKVEVVVVDAWSWVLTITHVEPTYATRGSVIPAIKALRGVGTNENGLPLGLREAKDVIDGVRTDTLFSFTLIGEAAAKDAKKALEAAGMTVTVTRAEE